MDARENTDRELWRDQPDDYYAPSLHVTAQGGIGMNVGGTVIVKRLREWHALAARPTADLGEDGELVDWLLDCVATAEEACKADGDNEVYAERHAKMRQAADRLILYREALAEAYQRLVKLGDDGNCCSNVLGLSASDSVSPRQ